MRQISIVLCSLVLVAGAAAIDLQTRPVGPVVQWQAAGLERFDPAWLHVKIVEGASVALVSAPTASGLRFEASDGADVTALNRLVAEAKTLRRTFTGPREKFQEWKARGEAATGQVGPDLSLWFDVQFAADRAALADALNAINALDIVEIAHPAPICEPAVVLGQAVPFAGAPDFPTPTPDFTPQQTYLFDTPTGLDAPSAWAKTGGRGAGMKFIDVELGWTHKHEDFDQNTFFYKNANQDPSYIDHGTAVVGEVVGAVNGYGVTGFASDTKWGTVGILIGEWPNVPHHFQTAIDNLDPGDAWLIELQMYPQGKSATPMEWLQANYDVIWAGCWGKGVICMEAGANGSQNLDDPGWQGVFDRKVRDSGAIMVGAGTPTGRVAESFTNYGSRMDVHAWGSQIVTTGYGDLYTEGTLETEYTAGFGGTSGASPMCTGSALCVQGIARDRFGKPQKPDFVRRLLNKTGIPNLGTKYIGPRPDLGAAVDLLLGLGDLNCDGKVDFGDINPFVLALSDPDEYKKQYPNCDINYADCNLDGAIDFGDINSFVELLGG